MSGFAATALPGSVQTLLDLRHQLFHSLPRGLRIEIGAAERCRPCANEPCQGLLIAHRQVLLHLTRQLGRLLPPASCRLDDVQQTVGRFVALRCRWAPALRARAPRCHEARPWPPTPLDRGACSDRRTDRRRRGSAARRPRTSTSGRGQSSSTRPATAAARWPWHPSRSNRRPPRPSRTALPFAPDCPAHCSLRCLRSSWRRVKKRSQAPRNRSQIAFSCPRVTGPIVFQSA